MGPSGKWIDGILPDDSVADAARLSLSARLTDVAHWLPLAAYHADQDVEHVHRLRVSTRRAMAALRLYRDWLPRQEFRRIKKRLKKIRRAAGEARDLDVLAERVKSELADRATLILKEINELRVAAQPAVLGVTEKFRRDDRFVRRIGKLLESIRPPHPQDQSQPLICFRDWAEKQLVQATDVFFSAVPSKDADVKALHQFRIQTKALRYSIELLASAFGPELREVTYPKVEKLQERLGRIQDCVAGHDRLCELSREARSAEARELLDELAWQQDAEQTHLISEFRRWWTPDCIATFKSGMLFSDRGMSTGNPPVDPVGRHGESLAEPLPTP